MVRLTDDAASLLRRIQAGHPDADTLRLVNEAGELVVGKSATTADDQIISHQGLPVLSISPEAAELLAGSTIGIEQSGGEPILRIIPPGESSETP